MKEIPLWSKGKIVDYLGRFETEVEAEIAYNFAATQLYGEKATLNDIPEEYSNVIPMKTGRGRKKVNFFDSFTQSYNSRKSS